MELGKVSTHVHQEEMHVLTSKPSQAGTSKHRHSKALMTDMIGEGRIRSKALDLLALVSQV